MKMLALVSFAFVFSCASNRDQATVQSEEPSAREGFREMGEGAKEVGSAAVSGTKEVGRDIAEGTREAGRDTAAAARKAGRAIKSSACPVVGDKTTQIYYTKANKQYDAMLRGEKVLSSDNRECFASEENARESGYRNAAR